MPILFTLWGNLSEGESLAAPSCYQEARCTAFLQAGIG